MNVEYIKGEIKKSILAFKEGNLSHNSLKLFESLGYVTERQAPLNNPNFKEFNDTYIFDQPFDKAKAKVEDWLYIDLLFQLSKSEVLKQSSLFDTKQVDKTIIETYLFFVIELAGNQYSRTQLSLITREVNRLFPMPAMILFKYSNQLTLSVIHRRLHKRDATKNVLEKVTLVKDIRIEDPHRAHLEILFDLTFEKLQQDYSISNFVELHNAWQKTLDIKLLNEKFYKEIAYWFFWAVNLVEFPDDDPYYAKRETRNTENVIRLLTRVIFCWFMKEKRLIKPELFSQQDMDQLLIRDADITGSTYYKAILQNLFFATLNIPVKKRKFISSKSYQGKSNDYFDHSVFRYERYFKQDTSYLNFFKDIPFLNGGMFECQDYMGENEKGEKAPIRIDCFSNNPKNETRLKVPDEIFFGALRKENWLNDTFGTKNQDYQVRGLFNILKDYKFTIEENTPLEEEIALDPDLLGIVFENLLASYNPETRATARKQTGSFYTPREIVNYMVDESLIAYFSNKIMQENDEKLREFVTQHNSEPEFSDQEKDDLITAIETIKILDPACGSGAFPMGILNKLVHLIHKLDPENILWRERMLKRTPMEIRRETEEMLSTKSADYIRKLGLIQNCIYGVDIQPIAVEISKLRFFLALLVDFEKNENPEDNWGIEPLPNLDFKIMQGDSLVEEFNGVSLSITPKEKSGTFTFTDPELQDKITGLHEVQGFYLRETQPEKKKKLKAKTHDLLIDILHYHLQKIKSAYFSELKRIEDIKGRIRVKESVDNYYETEKAKIDQKFGFNFIKFEKDLKDLITGKKPLKFFPFSLFFADVFEKGGFDIVLANPPYINTKRGIDTNLKEIFKNNYKCAIGQFDLFCLFIEKSMSFSNIICYIVPKPIINNENYQVCRKMILENGLEDVVIGSDIFKAASVESCIFLANKNSIKSISVFQFEQDIFQFRWHTSKEVSRELPFEMINTELDLKNLHVIKLIQQDSENFGKLFTITRGIEAGKNDSCITNVYNDYKLLRGEDVTAFNIDFKNLYVEYNSTETSKFKPASTYEGEKILIRRVGNELISAYDNENYLNLNTIYNCKPLKKNVNLFYITALLNSSLLKNWFKKVFVLTDRLFPYVRISQLEYIPIKFADDEEFKFEILTKYIMFSINRLNYISKFIISLIDAMTYEIYFPEKIKESDCEILKHLVQLPDLNEGWSIEQKHKVVEKVYNDLSNPLHPINIAIFKMDTIEEIAIIEGKL